MKQLPLLASTLYCQPWCILPEVHLELSATFRNYLAGTLPAALSGQGGDSTGGLYYEVDHQYGIALIQMNGIVVKKAMPDMCGPPLIDLALLDRLLVDIADDPSIRTLVLDLDTPGGTVIGLQETALRMQAVKDSGTRIVAYTDALCASAGYWLAAKADEIVAAPSAQVGSIGVYIAAIDDSRAWEMDGLKLKLFKNGDLKAMGHPGKEWTTEEEEFLQTRVDARALEFKDHVRSHRPGIAASTMQGQTFDAGSAPVGLVDRIALDLSDVLQHEIGLLVNLA
jgi:signal peptide peptidase SppA